MVRSPLKQAHMQHSYTIDRSYIIGNFKSLNLLVGLIPQGKQFNTFTNASCSGNLGLCGLPLTKTCGNDEGQQPPTTTTTTIILENTFFFIESY